MLHVIYTRLHPGHLSARVEDGSRRSEETVKKSRFAPFSAVITTTTTTAAAATTTTTTTTTTVIIIKKSFPWDGKQKRTKPSSLSLMKPNSYYYH